jgi:hypothetical protein
MDDLGNQAGLIFARDALFFGGLARRRAVWRRLRKNRPDVLWTIDDFCKERGIPFRVERQIWGLSAL